MNTFFRGVKCVCWLALLLLLGGVGIAGAQPMPSGAAASSEPEEAIPIAVNADSLRYDQASGRIVASGNVVIVSGADRLLADHVTVDRNTGDLLAKGNVQLERDGKVIRGAELLYNTITRISSLDAPRIDSEPFHITADNVTRTDDATLELERAKVTTCDLDHDHAHYHVRARHLRVIPGDHLRAKHAVWYLGRVPVFYVPYWKRRLHDDYGWHFYPGYRSRWGGYLLSSYFHRITPNLRLEHHVDVYSERGVGFGEDVDWRVAGGSGKLSLYYINDNKPQGKNPPESAPAVDASRYRIFLRHDQQLDPYTRLLVRGEYVSDSTLRRDFFDRAYRQLRQPENVVTLAHQQDLFTVTALANYRLNDFYGNVNRIPEISLNWYRMQLGDTSFYYESRSSAAFLQRVHPRDVVRDETSTLRLDTLHSLYQPRQIAGWLNVVPRASYRATYYSNSRNRETAETVSTQSVTNAITLAVENVSTTNTLERFTDGSMQLRQVLEIGSEVSFKAFKRLPDSAGGQPWRHVVEPYLNYALRFKPTVEPDALYDYDAVDRVDKVHQARIGVRNLLQTKWGDRSVEAVDLNVFTTANLDTKEGEDMFSTVSANARFQPNAWLQIENDGVYSLEDAQLATFNSRLSLSQEASWRVGVEHRFRNEVSNLVMLDTTIYPNRAWSFNLFSRYEFEASRLEEQGGYLQRNFDCMSIRLGGSVLPGFTRTDGTQADDDYRVVLAFWLNAFPEMAGSGFAR